MWKCKIPDSEELRMKLQDLRMKFQVSWDKIRRIYKWNSSRAVKVTARKHTRTVIAYSFYLKTANRTDFSEAGIKTTTNAPSGVTSATTHVLYARMYNVTQVKSSRDIYRRGASFQTTVLKRPALANRLHLVAFTDQLIHRSLAAASPFTWLAK